MANGRPAAMQGRRRRRPVFLAARHKRMRRSAYERKYFRSIRFSGVAFLLYVQPYVHARRRKESAPERLASEIIRPTFRLFGVVIQHPRLRRPDDYHAAERLRHIGAKENFGQVYITEPYLDANTGNMRFTVSTMLSDGDTVVAMDFNFSKLQESILQMTDNKEYGAKGEFLGIFGIDFLWISSYTY